MKIYRHPQTDPTKCELTDEINFSEKKDLVGFKNGKSVNITIDKDGLRGSMAYLEFEESDLENLHQRYIDYLKEKCNALEMEVQEISELALSYKRRDLKNRANWDFVSEVISNKSKWLGYLNEDSEADETTIEDLFETMSEDIVHKGEFDSIYYGEKFDKHHKDYLEYCIDPEEYKEL